MTWPTTHRLLYPDSFVPPDRTVPVEAAQAAVFNFFYTLPGRTCASHYHACTGFDAVPDGSLRDFWDAHLHELCASARAGGRAGGAAAPRRV
jgi:hypothetical protein